MSNINEQIERQLTVCDTKARHQVNAAGMLWKNCKKHRIQAETSGRIP